MEWKGPLKKPFKTRFTCKNHTLVKNDIPLSAIFYNSIVLKKSCVQTSCHRYNYVNIFFMSFSAWRGMPPIFHL